MKRSCNTFIKRTGQVVSELVDISVCFEEQSDHWQVSTLRCQVTGRLTLMRQMVHINTTTAGGACCTQAETKEEEQNANERNAHITLKQLLKWLIYPLIIHIHLESSREVEGVEIPSEVGSNEVQILCFCTLLYFEFYSLHFNTNISTSSIF